MEVKTAPARKRTPAADQLPPPPRARRGRSRITETVDQSSAVATIEADDVPIELVEPAPAAAANEIEEERPHLPPLPALKGKKQLVEPAVFIRYWNEKLDSTTRKRCVLYLYRNWPVMKPELKTVRGQAKFQNTNCDKFSDEDGPLSMDLIRSRNGFGDYYMRLNQNFLPPCGTVMTMDFELPRTWDDENGWPMINFDNLDRSDPQNADYIKRLIVRGILKQEGENSEEENEMGTAAQQVMGDTIKSLSDHIINKNGSGDGAATPVGVKLAEILEKQIERNQPTDRQGTVADYAKTMIDMAKQLTPAPQPPPDHSAFLTMIQGQNALLLEMKQERVVAAENSAREERERRLAAEARIPLPKTLSEQLAELDSLEALRNRVRGNDGANNGDHAPAAAAAPSGFWGSVPSILEHGKSIVAMATNAFYNYVVMTKGSAVNPETGTLSREPIAPDMRNQFSPEQLAEMEEQQVMMDTLGKIQGFLLNYLAKGRTGGEFAQLIINMSDLIEFEKIRSKGKERILAACAQYPPLWDQLKGMQPKVERFLDEFMAYQPPAQV